MKRYIQSAVHDDITDENTSYSLLAMIARETVRPAELLRLAGCQNSYVQNAVLDNPNTPDEAFELLANSDDVQIWQSAYDHLGKTYLPPDQETNEDVLLKYAKSSDLHVIGELGNNPNLTPAVYEALANSTEFAARMTAACSGGIPEAILRRLRSCDPAVSIRTTAKENLKLRSQYKKESAE